MSSKSLITTATILHLADLETNVREVKYVAESYSPASWDCPSKCNFYYSRSTTFQTKYHLIEDIFSDF